MPYTRSREESVSSVPGWLHSFQGLWASLHRQHVGLARYTCAGAMQCWSVASAWGQHVQGQQSRRGGGQSHPTPALPTLMVGALHTPNTSLYTKEPSLLSNVQYMLTRDWELRLTALLWHQYWCSRLVAYTQ